MPTEHEQSTPSARSVAKAAKVPTEEKFMMGEKPFLCTMNRADGIPCEKRFVRKSDLGTATYTHIYTHTHTHTHTHTIGTPFSHFTPP